MTDTERLTRPAVRFNHRLGVSRPQPLALCTPQAGQARPSKRGPAETARTQGNQDARQSVTVSASLPFPPLCKRSVRAGFHPALGVHPAFFT